MSMYCEVCRRNIKKSVWGGVNICLKIRKRRKRSGELVVEEVEKKSNVVNVQGIRCWKRLGERMLLVMDALLIDKNGLRMIIGM